MEQRQNNIKNRETNIKDMCLACLEKAGVAIVAAIVFAIVFAVLGYTSEKKSIENAKAYVAQYETDMLAEESERETTEGENVELSDSEKELVEVYLESEESYQEWLYYSQNSPLMRVNPNAMPTNRLNFLLRIHDSESENEGAREEKVAIMKELYSAVIEGEAVKEKIEKVLGEDKASFYSEYINLRTPTVVTNEDGTVCIFDVEVYGETEKECLQVSECIQETVTEYSKSIVEQYGEHKIELASNEFTIEANSSYVQNKKDKISNLIDVRSKYKTLRNELNEKQNAYLGIEVPQEVETESTEEAESSMEEVYLAQKEIADGKAHVSLAMVIAGALCGIVLYMLFISIGYLQNNNISVYDNYEKIFQSKLLGIMFGGDEKENGLTKFVRAKRLKNVHIMNKEKHSAYTLEVLKNELEKLNGNKCVIVSFDKLEELTNMSGELKTVLKNCEYLPEILTDGDAYNKLETADAVIIAEGAGKTPYWAIAKELDLIENENKKIVGTILFD